MSLPSMPDVPDVTALLTGVQDSIDLLGDMIEGRPPKTLDVVNFFIGVVNRVVDNLGLEETAKLPEIPSLPEPPEPPAGLPELPGLPVTAKTFRIPL